MIKKVGVPFYVELNSHQKYFGATGFQTKVVNLSDNTISVLANDATEIIEDISDAHTGSLDAAAAVGSKTLTMASGSTLVDGDVFVTPDGDMYYIESVVGDTINLKYALSKAIAYGDSLTQVGNTGMYKIEVTINSIGNYGIYVSNPSINMRLKGVQYTIKDIVIDDIADQLEALDTKLTSKLDGIQNTLDNSDSSEFTVFAG